MLEDLSQHVLDIAENSVAAQATEILIEIVEDRGENLLRMTVADNGVGMSAEFAERVTDPFTTTRTTRRVGMGIPFLKQSAELCGGSFRLESEKGVGTRTEANFLNDSIDRPPLGDMPATTMALFMGHPEIDWTYRHRIDADEFTITTEELVEALEDRELLRSTEVGLWVRDLIRDSIGEMREKAYNTDVQNG